MKRLKEKILRGNQLSTSSSTDNSTPSPYSSTDNSIPSTSSSTDNFTARSSDTYIYAVGIVAFLAIGACVFFAYNKISPQATNKKQVNQEQRQLIKLTKRRNALDMMVKKSYT